MADMRLLAELLDRASERHGGASGRRLAVIAQENGYDVSHSTLNKIRSRTYESEPSVETLRAVAFLAAVSEEKVLARFTDPDGVRVAEVERAFTEWLNAWNRLQNAVLNYARIRQVSLERAEEELEETKAMFEAHRLGSGRPWTPPWNPGADFEEDEEPWKADFWSYTAAVPSPFGGEGHVYQLGHTYDLAEIRARRETTAHADKVWKEEKAKQAEAYYQRRAQPGDPEKDAELEAWIRRAGAGWAAAEPGRLSRIIKRHPSGTPSEAVPDLTPNDHDQERGQADFGAAAARTEDDPKEDSGE